MSQKQRLEVDNLLTKLGDGGGKCIILRREDFDLGLEVREPLLLALSALESRNTVKRSSEPVHDECGSGLESHQDLPIPFQEVPPLLFISHLLRVLLVLLLLLSFLPRTRFTLLICGPVVALGFLTRGLGR